VHDREDDQEHQECESQGDEELAGYVAVEDEHALLSMSRL
jgi:hypothetical protein